MTLLLLALAFGQLPGTFTPDPRLDWYTLATPHFRVHFSARGTPGLEDEALARRVGGIAEEVADRFAELGVPRPAGPVHLVVADVQDRPNGWASPLPRNTITIFPVLPSGDRVAWDDALRTLIIHEYAHVEQLDRAAGLVSDLRGIFGRVILTTPLAPVWLLEGYAQLWETRLTGYGRLRSAEYEMMLRSGAWEDQLLSQDRCATYELERWPAGNAPYLYGGMFCAWLAGRTAAGGGAPIPDPTGLPVSSWERYNRERARLFPFTGELAAHRVWGNGFSALWPEWQDSVRATAERVRRAVAGEQVTPLRWLTNEGWNAGSPCWSGSELLYLSRDRAEYPSIRALDTATGRTRVLHQAQVHGALSLSPDGMVLAFSRHDVGGDFHERSGVWLLDLADKSVRPILPGRRLRDPDFEPGGNRLACVAIGAGCDTLVLIDASAQCVEPLIAPAEPTGFSRPCFSPDGRYLAYCVNRPEGRADIELLEMASRRRIAVTDDRANDISPCWSNDGRLLYFVSDRTGVFNLHAWDPATGELRRCTNVLTGVFEPAVGANDSTVAVAGYTARGYDIALLSLRPSDWQPARKVPAGSPVPAPTPASGPIRPYSALPGLAPTLWFPIVRNSGVWQAGGQTLGWDPLHFHEYVVAAGWRFSGTPFLTIDYALTRFRPWFRLAADLDIDRREVQLGMTLPFPATRRSSRLDLGIDLAHDSVVRTRFDLGLATSTALRYRGQPAPTEGLAEGLQTWLESRPLAGARDRIRFAGYVIGFLEPWPDASLRLEAAAATAVGDRSADSAWVIVPGPGVLAVRGWSRNGRASRSIAGLRTELRVRAWQPERGLEILPLFLSGVSLAGFLDGAIGWNGLLPSFGSEGRARVGTGLEARAELVVGHLLPVTLSAGAATAVLPEPLSSRQFYVEVESPLLAGLLSQRERRQIPGCP